MGARLAVRDATQSTLEEPWFKQVIRRNAGDEERMRRRGRAGDCERPAEVEADDSGSDGGAAKVRMRKMPHQSGKEESKEQGGDRWDEENGSRGDPGRSWG